MRTQKQIEHVAIWLEDAKLGLISSENLHLSYRHRDTSTIHLAIAQHYKAPLSEIAEIMPEPYLEFYRGEDTIHFNIWLSRAWYNLSCLTDPCEDEDSSLRFQSESDLRELRRQRDAEDPDTLRQDKDLWERGYLIPKYPSED